MAEILFSLLKLNRKRGCLKMNQPTKFIDLFCGIGSFHHSFKKVGYECIFACDINEDARNTYKKNYGLTPRGDICSVDVKDVDPYDILCAGFPCQSFSIAGKQKGFKDERGNMFLQIMRFVDYHNPKIILLENVPALLTHDNKKTFGIIQDKLKSAGYDVTYSILKCSDYGIPQMRKRLFIVASKPEVKLSPTILNFETSQKSVSLTVFLNKTVDGSDEQLKFEKQTAYTIRCGGRNSGIEDKHNWDGYWTTQKNGKRCIYRLTIQDCLKLQGFPSDFILVGNNTAKWQMVGNTIPTIFTELIAGAIRNDIQRR